MKICKSCTQWTLLEQDNFCCFCGNTNIDIDISQNEIFLTSGINESYNLQITNNGQNSSNIDIVNEDLNPEFISFCQTNITIEPNSYFSLNIYLNRKMLHDDFLSSTYNYRIIVDNNPIKALSFALTAKKGPTPKVSPPELDFGRVQEGEIDQKEFSLSNSGAVPLILAGIGLDGLPHLSIENAKELPVVLKTGDFWTGRVKWDSAKYPPKNDPSEPRLNLSFKNCPDPFFLPVKGKVARPNISFGGNEIRKDSLLSKQVHNHTVILKNAGNIDLEIFSIEARESWIETAGPSRVFTLLCDESISAGAKTDRESIFEEYPLKLIFRPEGLGNGLKEGIITVHTNHPGYKLEISVKAHVVEPEDSQDYIGIDFGTTNSVLAIFDNDDNDVRCVETLSFQGKPTALIPSILVFDGGPDNYIIGHRAQNEATVSPELAIRSIKRVMGYGNEREFFGRIFSPEDLAACIIRKLREMAEEDYYRMTNRYLNFRHAIVTVPANFFDVQIRAILAACKMAGIDTEEEMARSISEKAQKIIGKQTDAGIILDEPSAAAIFFLKHLDETDEVFSKSLAQKGSFLFLVYDHGGGTLDVSVARASGMAGASGVGLEILSNKGDNVVGGDSIDLSLMKNMLDECKAANDEFDNELISCNFKEMEGRRFREGWDNQLLGSVLAARTSWKAAAEALKIELSEKNVAMFSISGLSIIHIEKDKIVSNQKHFFEFEVSRSKMEGWIAGILANCQKAVRGALELAEMDPDSIDYILHTGRSSLMPSVRQRVRELFPRLPDTNDLLNEEHLKTCVAKGAAMYGSFRRVLGGGGGGIHLIAEGRKLPHGYGVVKVLNIAHVYDPIIQIGTPYPVTKEKYYPPEDIPNKEELRIIFLQNTGTDVRIRKDNKGIRRIGEIVVNPEADGQPGVNVKFIVGPNRMLEVFADGQEVKIKPERMEDEDRWVG